MFKWILLFIIFIAAVHYFNIDVRSIVEYVLGASSAVWNYIKDPLMHVFDTIKEAVK